VIKIRSETPSDVAAIEAVTAAAFLNAPHTSHMEQFIVNALRKAAHCISKSLIRLFNGIPGQTLAEITLPCSPDVLE
jgi:putative acetyltransferase